MKTNILDNSDDGKALVKQAASLQQQGLYDEALPYCIAALATDFDDSGTYIQLGKVLEAQGLLSQAQASYYRADMAHEPRREVAHSNVLYLLNHDVLVEAQHLFSEHVAFGTQFEAPLQPNWLPHPNLKDPARVLQVGFVSGDFNHHALADFLLPLFRQLHQHTGLVTHAFYTKALKDDTTERLRHSFDKWHDIADLSDTELADFVRAQSIDILIDLTGHTAKNRLLTFARKPAPVQLSWLGYLGTTGLTAMDYYLCDPYWITPGEVDWQFVEKMAYLPSAVTFEADTSAPAVSTLPALNNGYITFGSFNRPNKINQSVIVLWSMLLRSLPTARLIIGATEPSAQEALKQSFASEGIEPERLHFFPRNSKAVYLGFHQEVDICLDTFPHAGGATTANAAWMGVPTLGLAGQTPASRFGAALMHQLGLDDFVAGSIEEFVHIGRYWSQHLAELAQLRTSMRQRFAASMLGQPEAFAEAFATMLRNMWQGWCNAAAVRSITVEDSQNANTNRRARVEPGLSEIPPVLVISASKLTESDFWSQSALGLSLSRLSQQGENIRVDIAFENKRGLPEIFNAAIECAHDDDILVFVHDDVWIDEYHFAQTVAEGLLQFDVIGVAGNKRRLPNQPAWCFIDQEFTWDDKCQLSGQVGHGANAFGQLAEFGAVPAACELLDGAFIATCKGKLNSKQVWFDPLFGFHLYDLDFCRAARLAGLTLGTWAIYITHQSGGVLGQKKWRQETVNYFKKWGDKNCSISEKSLKDYPISQLPLVSILIPTHNRPDYFEIALKSALAQKYPTIEIIVSDNSDDDLTKERISSYLKQYKNIIYYKKKGMPVAENVRKCLELSKGLYINYLMDDDLFHPDKIERMMFYYIKYPNIGLVTSFRQLINEQGNFIPQKPGMERLYLEDTFVSGPDFADVMIKNGINLIGEPTTVLLRRSDIGNIFGMYENREYISLSDVAVWLSIINTRNFVYISDTLSYFRIHSEQGQLNSYIQIQGTYEWLLLFLKYFEKNILSKKESGLHELLNHKMSAFSSFFASRHEYIREHHFINNDIVEALNNGFKYLLKND